MSAQEWELFIIPIRKSDGWKIRSLPTMKSGLGLGG